MPQNPKSGYHNSSKTSSWRRKIIYMNSTPSPYSHLYWKKPTQYFLLPLMKPRCPWVVGTWSRVTLRTLVNLRPKEKQVIQIHAYPQVSLSHMLESPQTLTHSITSWVLAAGTSPDQTTVKSWAKETVRNFSICPTLLPFTWNSSLWDLAYWRPTYLLQVPGLVPSVPMPLPGLEI